MTNCIERDKAFIASLYYHLFKRSPEAYVLRRMLGRDYNESVPAYIAFLKVADDNVDHNKEAIYFLVACLFYKTQKFDLIADNSSNVSFAKLLSRIYGISNSTDKTIASFLNTDYDENGVFTKQFIRICYRCLKEIHSNEKLDYLGLLLDLKSWNDEDHKTRLNWAKIITKNDKEDTVNE